MRCSKCGADNREAARFCDGCGAQMLAQCPSCGTLARSGARFCDSCGAALIAAAPVTIGVRTPVTPLPVGERRHLTVLFCDLVNSTSIAAQLDPEEWREMVGAYHRAAAEAITRYGGHVAKYLGDGVMALFGYPEAHDDDAERATRAGLAILDAISKLNEEPERPKLAVRVGIDSGPVVVGAGAGREPDIFGEAPNVAARVQAVAEPDTVLITAATHRLVSGLFVVEERNAQVLRGIARPTDLYRVIRPSGMRGRLAAAAAVRGMTSFIDREEELRLLLSRWQRAREGEGQVITIVGEAGIGKSRLVQHFREQIGADPHTWLECATAAFFQNTPFYAFTDMLQQTFHWHSNQNIERRLAALEASLTLAGLKLEKAVPLIASLLGLPLDSKYPGLTMAPEQQRKRLIATLVAWITGFAKVQPLVLATEDLHWADPSTLEVIQLAVEQGATVPLLLLHTARPEFRIQWPLRSHHTQITLDRLSAHNVRTMIGQVAAQKALSEAAISAVVERTTGVPLFVEELTRAVLESSGAGLSAHEIPVTLHDSLMARLDRLGVAKEVLQMGAVIGSEFSYQLLHAVHPMPGQALRQALLTLSDSDLLYVRGIAPDATYLFKHALIRDAAYEALLKSRRRELHRIVASTINEKFPEMTDAHPEVLARHWTEAGEVEPAIAEWSRAGKAAEVHNAFSEALENYTQAAKLLENLPEAMERDTRELELRQRILELFYMTKGFAAPETIDAIQRAAKLAEKTDNLARVVGLINTRGFSAYFSGDLRAAGALADHALELASGHGWPSVLANIHFLQVTTRYLLGDLAGVEKYFSAGLKFFDDPGFLRERVGAVAVFSTAATNAWVLGHVESARERIRRSMAAAHQGNPFVVASSLLYAAGFWGGVRDYAACEALSAEALQLSEKHQLGYVRGFSCCILGHARAQLGRTAEGISLIRKGLASLAKGGLHLRLGYFTSLLAAAEEREGTITNALETVARSLELNTDELVYRPEILRLRGDLQVKQGQPQLAEMDFREALALARRMGAKAWELRSTMSLSRLLVGQHRRDEARTMLAEIYGWFTEGFDTADLKEAKVLLDELAS
jgi:class 3 adenylate cyclase/tetratricopeptide (TPR) repeat protein